MIFAYWRVIFLHGKSDIPPKGGVIFCHKWQSDKVEKRRAEMFFAFCVVRREKGHSVQGDEFISLLLWEKGDRDSGGWGVKIVFQQLSVTNTSSVIHDNRIGCIAHKCAVSATFSRWRRLVSLPTGECQHRVLYFFCRVVKYWVYIDRRRWVW